MVTEYEGKVLSATETEDAHNLYDLTVRMKQLVTDVKNSRSNEEVAANGDKLADVVFEFLKVSGWSRS